MASQSQEKITKGKLHAILKCYPNLPEILVEEYRIIM